MRQRELPLGLMVQRRPLLGRSCGPAAAIAANSERTGSLRLAFEGVILWCCELRWWGGNFMRVLAAIVFCILTVPSWAEEAIITDGDTLILKGTPYRLDGIDAPETDQVCLDEKRNVWACGLEARDQLRKIVGTRDVRCDTKGYDTVYRNRRIGVCWIEGETTSLNQWLVKEGWALNFEHAKGRFKADEDDARSRGRGLWNGCFSRPKDTRRWNKGDAPLLGAGCPPSKEIRDTLFPSHPTMPIGYSYKGEICCARTHNWPSGNLSHGRLPQLRTHEKAGPLVLLRG